MGSRCWECGHKSGRCWEHAVSACAECFGEHDCSATYADED